MIENDIDDLLASREAEFSRERNGRPEIAERLGESIFRASIHREGVSVSGICKFYSEDMGPGWREAMFKQMQILDFLNMRGLSAGELLDLRMFRDESGREVGLIFRGEVEGESIRDHVQPVEYEEAVKRADKLFCQLAEVSQDPLLIEEKIAFCGDLSAGNVIGGNDGYTIVDWDSKFGLTRMRDVTAGYVAPEVVDTETVEFSEVGADTYSLGSVLARVIVGQKVYRGIVPYGNLKDIPNLTKDERDRLFLTFDKIARLVPEGTHEFFRTALSQIPEERLLPTASNPAEHYKGLRDLFINRS